MQHEPGLRVARLNEVEGARRLFERDTVEAFGGEDACRRAFVRSTGIAPRRFRRDCSAAAPLHQM